MMQDAARVRLREIKRRAASVDDESPVLTVFYRRDVLALIALVREACECFRLIAPNDDWSGFENAQGEPVEQPIMAWLAKVED